jgi:ABC-2 type transport system permease protein
MRRLYAIYRKEMGHYFVSPVAYVVVGLFLFVTTLLFNGYLRGIMDEALQASIQGMQFGGAQPFDVPGLVMRQFFGVLTIIFLLFLPLLTMGAYADERKRGTMELLMTSPITELEIVLGKFLASLTVLVAMLLPTASYLVYMCLRSDPVPPWRLLLAGYAGVLLFGASLLALGSFLSSLTESQIVAGALTFGIFLALWVMDFSIRGSDSAIGQLLQYLSVIRHFDDFTRGVIDTTALVYYASFISLFVFLAVRSIDSMRWRRA